jgi:hypothetical protein
MGEKIYLLCQDINYYSDRFGKWVHIPWGYPSDGATGAPDLKGPIKCTRKGEPFLASLFWWVHDRLCETGCWEDGTKCSNLDIALVAYDILKDEGHNIRDFWWALAMFIFGGGKARLNGMFHVAKVARRLL